MTFCGDVEDDAGLMLCEQFAYQLAIANIALHESVPIMAVHGCEIFQIARVGKEVEVDDVISRFDQPFDDVRADESCPASDKNIITIQ